MPRDRRARAPQFGARGALLPLLPAAVCSPPPPPPLLSPRPLATPTRGPPPSRCATRRHSSCAGSAPPTPLPPCRSFELPRFQHLLIVFGGVEGLEPVVASEEGLADCEDDVASLFDAYLNLCPTQGSRTIRTEEALLVGMTALRPHIQANQ